MIWLILLILAILSSLYLTAPLLPAKTRRQKWQISLFLTGFIAASLGTYGFIGAPHLSDPSQTQAENQPSPPSQTRPEQVTPEQITAMVEGLAARLADEPEDVDGWIRLIRSRIVLGDIPNLIQDHKTMSKVYETRPEIIAKISQESGFNAFAARISEQK